MTTTDYMEKGVFMCGFAGFVGEVENRNQVLTDMMNTIVHRGPDSEGDMWMKMQRWDFGV